MATNDQGGEVLKKLDTIIAIMQLAFRDQIDVARQQMLADPIAAEILGIAANDWVDAGELKKRVAEETKQSERTVLRRIAVLVGQRALDQAGSGRSVRYRATGII
jgi:hypothetical protein